MASQGRLRVNTWRPIGGNHCRDTHLPLGEVAHDLKIADSCKGSRYRFVTPFLCLRIQRVILDRGAQAPDEHLKQVWMGLAKQTGARGGVSTPDFSPNDPLALWWRERCAHKCPYGHIWALMVPYGHICAQVGQSDAVPVREPPCGCNVGHPVQIGVSLAI